METIFQAAVIGLLQGLTEFIPVSSSAHLELAPWLFGWDAEGFIGSLAFDVFLHLGTLLALLAYFARDWVRLIGAGLASIRERSIGGDPDRRLAWLLAIATVPAAIIGFVFETSSRVPSTATRTRRAWRSPASSSSARWASTSPIGWALVAASSTT
jgi:undecaprenyl-diphosphatase